MWLLALISSGVRVGSLPSQATAEPSAEITGLLLPLVPSVAPTLALTSVVGSVRRLRFQMLPLVPLTLSRMSPPPERNVAKIPLAAIIPSDAPLIVPVPVLFLLTIEVDWVMKLRT